MLGLFHKKVYVWEDYHLGLCHSSFSSPEEVDADSDKWYEFLNKNSKIKFYTCDFGIWGYLKKVKTGFRFKMLFGGGNYSICFQYDKVNWYALYYYWHLYGKLNHLYFLRRGGSPVNKPYKGLENDIVKYEKYGTSFVEEGQFLGEVSIYKNPDVGFMRKVIEDFHAKYPNITIRIGGKEIGDVLRVGNVEESVAFEIHFSSTDDLDPCLPYKFIQTLEYRAYDDEFIMENKRKESIF